MISFFNPALRPSVRIPTTASPAGKIKKAFCLFAILLGLGQPLAAQTQYTWTGAAGDGNWNNTANWEGALKPVDRYDDAILPGLNGEMLIIFNADGPTNNVPQLRSSNKATDGSSDMPRIQVNQGTVGLRAKNDAFWKKSKTSTNPNFHMLQVGDGEHPATLNLIGNASPFELARFDQDIIPFTATVENHATLNFPDDIALTDGNGVDLQITVKGGGTLTSGALSVLASDLGSGESYIALESGGAYTFKSGTGLSTISEVTNYFGTLFRGIDGTVLEATPSGDLFTITSHTLPPQASSPTPSNGATEQQLNRSQSWADAANTHSYDIYFGTTGNLTYQTNQTTTSFTPGALAGLTGHEWRIAP